MAATFTKNYEKMKLTAHAASSHAPKRIGSTEERIKHFEGVSLQIRPIDETQQPWSCCLQGDSLLVADCSGTKGVGKGAHLEMELGAPCPPWPPRSSWTPPLLHPLLTNLVIQLFLLRVGQHLISCCYLQHKGR